MDLGSPPEAGTGAWAKKKKGWIEILPRFKIQYPMKNRGKNTKFSHISYA